MREERERNEKQEGKEFIKRKDNDLTTKERREKVVRENRGK